MRLISNFSRITKLMSENPLTYHDVNQKRFQKYNGSSIASIRQNITWKFFASEPFRKYGSIPNQWPNILFAKPISHNYISSINLPNRFHNPSIKNFLTFPFVFTQTRKDCLKRLLPTTKDERWSLHRGIFSNRKKLLVSSLIFDLSL